MLLGWISAAQAQEIRGGYVGLSYGSFDFTSDQEFGFVISDSAGAYRAFGGYQLNSNYAVEATWGKTDDIKEGFGLVDPVFGNVSLDLMVDYEIATVRFLGMAPLSSISIFGGGGFFDANFNRSVHYQDAFEVIDIADSDSDSGLMILGGIQFELRRIAIRGEYEWFDTDNVEATTITVSALLRF